MFDIFPRRSLSGLKILLLKEKVRIIMGLRAGTPTSQVCRLTLRNRTSSYKVLLL